MAHLQAIETKPRLGDALGVIDKLRADVESGRIIAFAAVGITPDDDSLAYSSSTRRLTRLRLQGGIAHLLHCCCAGELDADSET
jgi:hypothetical protein